MTNVTNDGQEEKESKDEKDGGKDDGRSRELRARAQSADTNSGSRSSRPDRNPGVKGLRRPDGVILALYASQSTPTLRCLCYDSYTDPLRQVLRLIIVQLVPSPDFLQAYGREDSKSVLSRTCHRDGGPCHSPVGPFVDSGNVDRSLSLGAGTIYQVYGVAVSLKVPVIGKDGKNQPYVPVNMIYHLRVAIVRDEVEIRLVCS